MCGEEAVLEAELSIHDDDLDSSGRNQRRRRRRKGKGPGAENLLPECRIMTLTSLPVPPGVGRGTTGHYVVAGCSDGVIRCAWNAHLITAILSLFCHKSHQALHLL